MVFNSLVTTTKVQPLFGGNCSDKGGNKMSQDLISTIQESLEKNPEVYIAKNKKDDLSYFQSIHWSGWSSNTHQIDFFVAPKETMYDSKKLNEFMYSLRNGQEKETKNVPKKFNRGFYLGHIFYKEELGYIRKDTKSEVFFRNPSDLKLFYSDESKTIPQEETEKINFYRHIFVSVFPSASLAEDYVSNANHVSNYGVGYGFVPRKMVRLHSPGLIGEFRRFMKKINQKVGVVY